jgi:hypothetical protein
MIMEREQLMTSCEFEDENDKLPFPWTRCPGCGALIKAGDRGCSACIRKYPDPVLKAAFDHYDYALGLKDGTVIRFTDAKIMGDYILLRVADAEPVFENGRREGFKLLPYPCLRGVAVRLDQIAWAVDAPYGH